MLQPGRNYNSPDYKYGFNGKEKTDEWNNNSGASYDYGFRIYDPRLGRFESIDPKFKGYPYYTPYQFAGNSPILNVDVDGAEDENTNEPDKQNDGGVPASTTPPSGESPQKAGSTSGTGTETKGTTTQPQLDQQSDDLSPEALNQRFEKSFVPIRSALVSTLKNPANKFGKAGDKDPDMATTEDIAKLINSIDYSKELKDNPPPGENPLTLRLTSVLVGIVPGDQPTTDVSEADFKEIIIVPEESQGTQQTSFGVGPFVGASTSTIIIKNADGVKKNVIIVAYFEVVYFQ
jgi:RHS repeat-associated protein